MDNQREVVAKWRRSSTYIVGVVAVVRSKVQIPENYEELSRKLLSSFPKVFQRVVTVANTYRWQAGERESCRRRGEKNRKNRNLVTMKWCFNTLKMLSYNRKLLYWLRNYEIYKSHPDDTRYHHKLKLRLKEKLSEKMLFFQPNSGYLDVMIASVSLEY